MPVRIVHSKQNARLKELRRALAHPPRAGAGDPSQLAGIEGPNLLREALRAGLEIETVFVAQGFEALLAEIGLPDEIDVLALPKEVLDSALTTESPQPVAALVHPPDWSWAHMLGGIQNAYPLLILLNELQDPGNLGTILRSAEAFGASGVICFSKTVSAWNPKAVRASAGSVFRLPILTVSERATFERLRNTGIKIWTTTAKGAQPADLVDLAGPVAIIIGNEGNGVSTDLARQAVGSLTIPCPGPVESLNAAVAASVLLYEAARQRVAFSGGPIGHRGSNQ
jgi:RNA methyltransferase, TrmH family